MVAGNKQTFVLKTGEDVGPKGHTLTAYFLLYPWFLFLKHSECVHFNLKNSGSPNHT